MAESLSDASLLERFVSDREEAAFVALVRRHGPRVERICRRILRNEHDVEDVFQATFLILARKAAAIPWRDSASPWIEAVARRLALHARSGAARLRDHEVGLTSLAGTDGGLPERFHPKVEPSADVERRDLRHVLDDELLRLPEKYRAPVVLCDLEGHTREEAARRLGWPTGSMSRRLDRGRSLLRNRLTGRGVGLGLIGLATLAIAATAIGLRPAREREASPIRQAMAAFRSGPGDRDGYGTILAAAARLEGAEADFARILPAARAAASAARELEEHDPGRSADLWSRLATEMRDSALDLEQACKASDTMAAVAAARRLDASCVRCHAAFGRASVPASAGISPRPRLADPPESTRTTRPVTFLASRAPQSPATTDHTEPAAARRSNLARPSLEFLASTDSLLLVSNDCMSAAVKTDGPGQRGFGPRTHSSTGGRCPPDPNRSRLDAWDARSRWDGLPA